MSITYHNQQFASAGYPQIFVINLRSSAERRESIREQLGKANIPYALVEAVDGKEITADTPAAYNYFKNQREELPANNTAYLNGGKNYQILSSILEHDMTTGEIGCFLSHCKIYAHIVEHKIPLSVILEDDVLLSTDFCKTLLGLKHYYHEYGVIFLGTHYFRHKSFIEKNCPMYLWGRKKVTSKTKLGHFIDIPFASHGYAVSRQGACGLLSLAMPMSVPLDWLLTLGLYDNRYKVAGVKPEVAVQDPAKNSTIERHPGVNSADYGPGKIPWKNYLKKRFPLLHGFWLAFRHFRRRLMTTMLQIFPTRPA